MKLALAVLAVLVLMPAGAYFDYARVYEDRLEWMAVSEPMEYQWFYGHPHGDMIEWTPATPRFPSSAPLGMPVTYRIKPDPSFSIRPGLWRICGYGFYAISWMVDCEDAVTLL